MASTQTHTQQALTRTHHSHRLFVQYRRAGVIRGLIAIHRNRLVDSPHEHLEIDALWKELDKTHSKISLLVNDPLSNDYCIDHPAVDECRMYDV